MPINIRVIDRENNETTLEWDEGMTLMEVLRDNDQPILASCGGCCSCATCHVFLAPEFTAAAGVSAGEERELLQETEAFRPDASRLSCQISFDPRYEGFSLALAPEE